MYRDVAQWHEIRSRILERGTPKKQVARDTGISRHTINKMLMHENPPSHGPRRYPKLGPYISAIDRLVRESASSTPKADLATRDIVERLRREHGFAGSHRLVSNYIRNRDDDNVWEKAYDLIVRLPKTRALDLIRLLSRGNPSLLMSARLRPFALEAALPRQTPSRPDRELRRLADIEWMRRVLQKEISDATLHNELNGIPDLGVLLKHLRNGRLLVRNRAMVVLANQRDVPSKTICAFLGVGKAFVRKCRKIFDSGGVDTLFARQSKCNRKIDNEQLRNAVFSMLHEPPADYGINRTSWTMSLLCQMLGKNGTRVGPALISKMIKAAGYKLRKAKVVLTSNDPNYRERLAHIHFILSNLKSNEAFFSIDEYGPFAIKTKPGRMLVPRGTQPTVPQWQKSRGCMIMTAALELSGNQVTHFYSAKKNTGEMIRMMDVLIERYAQHSRLYLSWDAASWHISKELFVRIEAHNAAVANGGGPLVETAPLPARAQFLNVIESVFSGMARAIIHNSDYKSVHDAKMAIDRYFAERNEHFRQHPRRAGKKIWGKEREPAAFSEANNCKDPRYR
jgi:transposase